MIGNEAVERAIDTQRAMLSLILRGLEPRLSAEERTAKSMLWPLSGIANCVSRVTARLPGATFATARVIHFEGEMKVKTNIKAGPNCQTCRA